MLTMISLIVSLLLYGEFISNNIITVEASLEGHRACSYDLCKADPVCSYHMYMDDNGADDNTFRFIYEALMKNMHITEDQAFKFCSNASDTELWLLVMRSYHYCKDANEYFNRHTGCVCRGGMLCQQTTAEHHSFYPATDIILGVSCLILFFLYNVRTSYMFHQIIKKQK